MPDPVDTDALRRDARVLSPGFPGVEKRLHAAADELDRLRAEMVKAIREIRASSSEAQFERERAEGYEREMTAMYAVIENAPHDSGCQFSFLPEDKPRRCTCWKAEAL